MSEIKKPQIKILLTGGCGYVGSVLIRRLIKDGYTIRNLDIAPLNPQFYRQHKKEVEFIREDIRNIKSHVFNDIETVIHLAAISDDSSADKNPSETHAVNTLATLMLAKKAKNLGVRRFIFASSSSIYNMGMDRETGEKNEEAAVSPSGCYSISKYAAEKELLKLADKNFCVVIFRKGTLYGFSPKMRFDLVVNAMVKHGIKDKVIKVFCRGLQWRPLLSIEDAVSAYQKLLIIPAYKINRQIFNIAYDNFLVRDIALIVQKTLDRHFFIKTAVIFEHDEKKDKSYRIKTEKIKRVLDFAPTHSLEQSIIDLAKKLMN